VCVCVDAGGIERRVNRRACEGVLISMYPGTLRIPDLLSSVLTAHSNYRHLPHMPQNQQQPTLITLRSSSFTIGHPPSSVWPAICSVTDLAVSVNEVVFLVSEPHDVMLSYGPCLPITHSKERERWVQRHIAFNRAVGAVCCALCVHSPRRSLFHSITVHPQPLASVHFCLL
jgi:hypothetical protein